MRENLIGQRFGKLLVLGTKGSNPSRNTIYTVVCDCGNYKDVTSNNLKSGHTKSCGCLRGDSAKLRLIDITGKKFGYLTVLERVPSRERTYWKVKCDCGTSKVVLGHNLKTGRTTSCGCKRYI